MSVCRKSPRTHFGAPVHVGQLHIDNTTSYSKITANNSGSACDTSPGLRYNEITETWQFSNNGNLWLNLGAGSGSSVYNPLKLTEIITVSVPVETNHTIPEGESYTLGNGVYMDIFVNGQLMTHDNGGNVIDYVEVDSTTIKFHFDIPKTSVIQYEIKRWS